MIFTGSNLYLNRNFYAQTGNVSFGMTCAVDNTTGVYHFGLSGTQGTQDFKLESGRLSYGTQFLHTYQSNRPFDFAVQFASGAVNTIKDGIALNYNIPKTTGSYDYFYFSRANASLGATFNLNVSGDSLPNYSITNQGYLLYSGQNAVTGRFTNNGNYPVKVFDSTMLATQNYTFGKLVGNVGAANSGVFAYSGDYDALDISDPILTTFNTNFGDVQQLFQITDARTVNRFVYLTAPTDFTFNGSNVLNRDTTWLNYSGGFVTDNYNTSLVFQLNYGTGLETFTGVWDLATGINSSNLVSLRGANQYTATMISGSGTFAPNSLFNLQVSYAGYSGSAAQLVISGMQVLNPINQTLNRVA